jgi:hypothetical protein
LIVHVQIYRLVARVHRLRLMFLQSLVRVHHLQLKVRLRVLHYLRLLHNLELKVHRLGLHCLRLM